MAYVDEVLADSPTIYWRLGEASGTTAVSEVNSPTKDGAYQNTPTLGVTGALTGSGDTDTAVSFARTSNERVLLSSAQSFGDTYTFELWIKRASIDVAMSLVFLGTSAPDFKITAANLIGLDKAAASAIVTSTLSITDTTTWHHVVNTKNGSTVKLYIDAIDRTGTVSNATMENGNQFVVAWGNQGYFDGSIDEVAAYPTALSAERVLAHYNAGLLAFQTALPNADSVDGAWRDQADGTSLFAAIDETSPSDSDYIRSELNPSNSGCRVKLASLNDPGVSTNHSINWRVGKSTTGGDQIDMIVKLYQGGGDSLGAGTLIADFTRTNVDAFTTYQETLSGGEADTITNYADLYLEFYADVP